MFILTTIGCIAFPINLKMEIQNAQEELNKVY